MHVALSIMEHKSFRDLIVYISPALEQLLARTGGTIRRWIIKEFERQDNIVEAGEYLKAWWDSGLII
jgi:hypothetical protein